MCIALLEICFVATASSEEISPSLGYVSERDSLSLQMNMCACACVFSFPFFS